MGLVGTSIINNVDNEYAMINNNIIGLVLLAFIVLQIMFL